MDLFIDNGTEFGFEVNPNALAGRKCVVTGLYTTPSKEDVKRMVLDAGGELTCCMSGATNYLICGNGGCGRSKLRKAHASPNCKVINLSEFVNIIKK